MLMKRQSVSPSIQNITYKAQSTRTPSHDVEAGRAKEVPAQPEPQ